MTRLCLIAAVAGNGEIGLDNCLPAAVCYISPP
jgi:hypothetical protein